MSLPASSESKLPVPHQSVLRRFGGTLLVLCAGCALGALCALGRPGREESSGGLATYLPTILRDAHAALEQGDYVFLPNRRSVWVVNRANGRMANYNFHDDELGSVDRSRVAQIDIRAFPARDTIVQLSDRNLNNILWVCNVRTGDVQMWTVARDGSLKGETPVASSTDLAGAAAGGTSSR